MGVQYEINKGVNRPIEFKGLKAQYIFYLAIGLAVLLILFSAMYITGVPVYLCLAIVLAGGSALFFGVYKYSHAYGEFGLMKAVAYRRIPIALVCHSADVFRKLSSRKDKVKSDDRDTDNSNMRSRSGNTAAKQDTKG